MRRLNPGRPAPGYRGQSAIGREVALMLVPMARMFVCLIDPAAICSEARPGGGRPASEVIRNPFA